MRKRKYRRYKRWTWEQIYIMNIAQRIVYLIFIAHTAKVLFNDDSIWLALRDAVHKSLKTEKTEIHEGDTGGEEMNEAHTAG